MEYLVTDIRDLSETWIAATSPREALVVHENRWRMTPLHFSTKASDHTSGALLDISLGQSAIHGRRENVTRGEGRITTMIDQSERDRRRLAKLTRED